MSKASIARQAKFRLEVATVIRNAGGEITVNDKDTLALSLNTPRIGPLTFTMFKGDDGQTYSLFIRSALQTNAEIQPVANKVKAAFGNGTSDEMNPFSGKWNIHGSNIEGVLSELVDHRLQWLMQAD